FTP
ncbi:hypothetical protein D048_0642, partial [Vibrio parahaemolyticus VPTS-2009]